jgi:hypothetical protein
MIKTIIKDEEHLFTEETVSVFSNREGVRSSALMKLKVAKLGNSLTWRYSLDPDGKVHFYRVDRMGDYHDESEVVSGCGGDVDIYVGDYVWFRSEGKFSTWGKMVPPRNPARRALWENFYFVPKQACRFELTRGQYDAILERWQRDDAKYVDEENSSFKVIEIKHIYNISNNKPVVSALMRRSWSNQKWRVVELAAIEGINGERLYANTLKICRMINEMNNAVEVREEDSDMAVG